MRRGVIATPKAAIHPLAHPLAHLIAPTGHLIDGRSPLAKYFTDLSGLSQTTINDDPCGAVLNLAPSGGLIAALNSSAKGRLKNTGGLLSVQVGAFAPGLAGGLAVTTSLPADYFFAAVYKCWREDYGQANPTYSGHVFFTDYGGVGDNFQFMASGDPGAGRFAVTDGGFWGQGTLAPANGAPVLDSGIAGWASSFREAGTHNLTGADAVGNTPASNSGAAPSKTIPLSTWVLGRQSTNSIGFKIEIAFHLYTPSLPSALDRAAVFDYIEAQYAGGW